VVSIHYLNGGQEHLSLSSQPETYEASTILRVRKLLANFHPGMMQRCRRLSQFQFLVKFLHLSQSLRSCGLRLLPLPLAGEVDAQSAAGGRFSRPHWNSRQAPPPQPSPASAGEGAHRRWRTTDARLRTPDGQISREFLLHPVQSRLQKYFRSRLSQITSYRQPSRPTEGRIMIVAYAGRDAVDASGAKDESAFSRTAKSCGPDASTPASSS